MTIAPLSSSPPPLGFDGVVSGLRTRGMIDKLMQLERAPVRGLQARRDRIQGRDQAYQDIKTRVAALQSAAQTLKLASAVNAKTATSASPNIVTATASPDAVAGTFTVSVSRLATATSLSSGGTTAPRAIGQAASSTATLNTAGLANPVSAGSFTINGRAISVDPAVDSLSSLVSRINSSGAGVTASLVADAYGRSNVLQLKSTTAGAPIQLGSSTDTSNFLAQTGLVSNGTDTVASAPLGAFQPTAALSATRPALVPSFAASGSFTINGKTINYTSADTLNQVMQRINSANAGVTAAYDGRTDRMTLTSQATGSASIALRDVTGNFLQATGLVDATNTSFAQSVGQTAAYQLNGGPTQYSNTNVVTAALPGITLNLLAAQTAGSAPITITVGTDTATVTKNVQAFVTAYNDLADAMERATRYDPTKRQSSPLTGDNGILTMAATTRRLITSPVAGATGQYRALADVGVSTGSVGSKPGTTSRLVLDATKLASALQANPSAVQTVVSGMAASLDTYLGKTLGSTGLFSSKMASTQAATRTIDRTLASLDGKLAMRQLSLEKRFTGMERKLARLQASGAYAATMRLV
jgi:flagellar hook-associated protein 2